MGLFAPFKKFGSFVVKLSPVKLDLIETIFQSIASKYELVSYARVQFVEGGVESKIHTRVQRIETLVPFKPQPKKVGSSSVPQRVRRKAA